MSGEESAIDDRAQRFRDAALPHLDEVYTVARYLMRNTNDAEDAVQECYLRALRHFDSFRGPAMKPWLLAILRNVCNGEFMQRRRREVPTDYAQDESAAEAMPMWQEQQTSPEKVMEQQDSARIWRLVAELPEPFREAIVLREMNVFLIRKLRNSPAYRWERSCRALPAPARCCAAHGIFSRTSRTMQPVRPSG
jgi:RNA polymerase sigma-70 factor, ECF subfamily